MSVPTSLTSVTAFLEAPRFDEIRIPATDRGELLFDPLVTDPTVEQPPGLRLGP